MFFILFFFFKSIKSHCKYTINVNKNVPLNYKFDLEETEFICINSTLPYLTVLFEPSQLLRINIYKETRNGQQFLKTMYTPGAYGGFDFSKEVGSMEYLKSSTQSSQQRISLQNHLSTQIVCYFAAYRAQFRLRREDSIFISLELRLSMVCDDCVMFTRLPLSQGFKCALRCISVCLFLDCEWQAIFPSFIFQDLLYWKK